MQFCNTFKVAHLILAYKKRTIISKLQRQFDDCVLDFKCYENIRLHERDGICKWVGKHTWNIEWMSPYRRCLQKNPSFKVLCEYVGENVQPVQAYIVTDVPKANWPLFYHSMWALFSSAYMCIICRNLSSFLKASQSIHNDWARPCDWLKYTFEQHNMADKSRHWQLLLRERNPVDLFNIRLLTIHWVTMCMSRISSN